MATRGDIARRRALRKMEARRDELIEKKARIALELANVKTALRNARKAS